MADLNGIFILRPALAAFSQNMEETLRRHDEKQPPFRDMRPLDLWLKLYDEVIELRETILAGGSREAICADAVDVGNYAMMIFDQARGPGKPIDAPKEAT